MAAALLPKCVKSGAGKCLALKRYAAMSRREEAMQESITQMGSEGINKLLLRFSLPSTISMTGMAAYNIVDTIFVGRLGSEPLAALSLAFPLQLIMGSFAIGAGVGAASLISRSLGAGNQRDAEVTVGQVVGLSLIFWIAVALIGYFFIEPLIAIFGAEPKISALAAEYLLVITTGSLTVFLMMGLNNVVRAMGHPVFSMKVLLTSALANIALDPVFIYAANLGVQGAAVATVVSRFIGVLIIMYFFFYSGKAPLKLRLVNVRLRWGFLVSIYRIGFPAMLLPLSRNISQIAANLILVPFGHIPVAVMGVFFRLQMLVFLPSVGVGQGLLPLIGYNFGAKQLGRAREVLLKGGTVITLYITSMTLVFFVFPEFMMSIFSPEEKVISLGGYALRIMVVMFPLSGIYMASSFFFQGIGRGMPSLFLALLREILLFIPFLLIFSYALGLTGVWVARPVSDLLAGAISLQLTAKELKRHGIPLQMPKSRPEEP